MSHFIHNSLNINDMNPLHCESRAMESLLSGLLLAFHVSFLDVWERGAFDVNIICFVDAEFSLWIQMHING